MAVCKKGKRKIICNGKQYFWYVAKDKELLGNKLNNLDAG